MWVGLILHLCANFSFVAWKEREKLEDDGRTYKTKYRVEWTYFMTLEINVRYILATFVFIRKKALIVIFGCITVNLTVFNL